MRHSSLATISILFIIFVSGLCSASAQAQSAANFPGKPVMLVSPYAPGGGADGDGRIWSQKLTESLGKPVVVDYKSGGGSTIGSNYVAKATPDGHTLLLITAGFSVTAVMRTDLPYDPIKDFAPVSLTHKRGAMLVVHPSVPYKTYPEYIAYLKAHPGEVNFATTGAGSIYHLVGAWLNSATNTRMTFVHYRGSGPLLVDLVAGRTQVAGTTFLTGWPFVKTGKLRALAGISSERSPLAPDLRTVAEQGIPDFEYSAWGGILAPANVPSPIINKLWEHLAGFARDPGVIEQFRSTGAIMIASSPADFRKYLVTEINRWGRLMKENGIQPGTED